MVIFHVSHLLYPSHSRGFSPQVALQSQVANSTPGRHVQGGRHTSRLGRDSSKWQFRKKQEDMIHPFIIHDSIHIDPTSHQLFPYARKT